MSLLPYVYIQVKISKILVSKIEKVNMFLTISFSVCFWCSKEPSQRDGSFEYQQHMFWLRKKKISFKITHS